ncbi:MAG: hypothetical protein J7J72_02025 [Bacteroidales bacterium]|nr:hypothetical protein [Bacteroidales bacterium]
MITNFILLTFIVGIVTGFIGVKYDRFFILLLIIFLFGNNISQGIEILLWTIFFGSGMVITENKEKIQALPKKMKVKLFGIIPMLALLPTLAGAYLYSISSKKTLLIILAAITLLYGLRMIFIHFKPKEMNYPVQASKFQKMCGLFGPIVSGFSLGLIGTSLKSLKIPFAVKVGKLNIRQVYLGNAFTAFASSGLALVWHNTLFSVQDFSYNFENYFLMAAALWTIIHFIAKITEIFTKDKWKKPATIIIGIGLLVAFVKLVLLFLQ